MVRSGREEENDRDGRAHERDEVDVALGARRGRRTALVKLIASRKPRRTVAPGNERAELLEQLVVLALEPRLERFRALGFEHLALELVGVRRRHAGAATPIVAPERRGVAARVRLAEPVLVESADPERGARARLAGAFASSPGRPSRS